MKVSLACGHPLDVLHSSGGSVGGAAATFGRINRLASVVRRHHNAVD
jgi:hypothetical protein